MVKWRGGMIQRQRLEENCVSNSRVMGYDID
jgi:hypothetical protein